MVPFEENTEVLSVIGPTASGKTLFSIELAKELDGEIVSVDSRQVYRFMDIGTDKIASTIRKEIPHHLIDVVDPDYTYSVADFASGAAKIIKGILERGRTPILAGGTPFYYSAFFSGILTEGLDGWHDVRSSYQLLWSEGRSEELYEKLQTLDPVTAASIHPNDSYRIIRSLSIIEKTGKNPTWWRDQLPSTKPAFRPFYVGLYPGRARLYQTISDRVKTQFASGYPQEVKWLLSNGYNPELSSMKGFGYRELAAYHAGKMTLEEALEGDIRSTKAFARRQMTWFRKFSPCLWYYVTGSGIKEQARNVIHIWKERNWKYRKG